MYTVGILIMALGDIVIGVSLQYNLHEIFGLAEDNVALKWMPVIGIGLVFFGVSCGQLQTIICLQGEIMPSFGRAIGQLFCASRRSFFEMLKRNMAFNSLTELPVNFIDWNSAF